MRLKLWRKFVAELLKDPGYRHRRNQHIEELVGTALAFCLPFLADQPFTLVGRI